MTAQCSFTNIHNFQNILFLILFGHPLYQLLHMEICITLLVISRKKSEINVNNYFKMIQIFKSAKDTPVSLYNSTFKIIQI